jgi:hypothetical protein
MDRRLKLVIVIREVIAALSAVPFLFMLCYIILPYHQHFDDIEMLLLLVFLVLIVIVGVPSIFVVRGLIANRRWALWLALVHDTIAIPWFVVLLLFAYNDAMHPHYFGIGLPLGLLMLTGIYPLVEALHLCAAMRTRRGTRYVFGALYILNFGFGLRLLWVAWR